MPKAKRVKMSGAAFRAERKRRDLATAAHGVKSLTSFWSSLQPTLERGIDVGDGRSHDGNHQKGYDSEPDLRDDQAQSSSTHHSRTLTRESGENGRARSRKKSRAPPPPTGDSQVCRSPEAPRPSVPAPAYTKSTGNISVDQPKKRLFRRHMDLWRRAGAQPATFDRAASEERWAPSTREMQEKKTRAQSIDCIRAGAMVGLGSPQQASSFASLLRTQSTQLTSLTAPEQARETPSQRQRGASESLARTRPCSISEVALRATVDRHPSQGKLKQVDNIEDHRITIAISSGQSSENSRKDQKPTVFYFGMEPHNTEKEDVMNAKEKTSAVTKVKHSGEHVSINGSSVNYRKRAISTGRKKSSAPGSNTTPGSGSDKKSSNGVSRIPSRKLEDFVNSLERNRQKQLSLSRDEILTNSSAFSCKSQSSVFDLEMEAAGDESISMHLRPTLPRKQLEVPRFSPLSAWRSLNLDQVASRQRPWRDGFRRGSIAESDASDEPSPQQSEGRARRCRPITKSADSGISGDLSSQPLPDKVVHSPEPPLAASTPTPAGEPGWVPAQDLDISSGGEEAAEAVDQRDGAATPPKLMSRADMFTAEEAAATREAETESKARNERIASTHTFNSLRQMKRSLSTAINALSRSPAHSIDDNWMLSRSVPTSLNGGDDELPSRPIDAKSDGDTPVWDTHVLYLPEYHSAKVDSGTPGSNKSSSGKTEGNDHRPEKVESRSKRPERRPTPEKPPRTSLNGTNGTSKKKFSYQSTMRLLEKKQLEDRLNKLAEREEQQRLKEQKLLLQVEKEFQRKRNNDHTELKSIIQQYSKRTSSDLTGKSKEGGLPRSGVSSPPVLAQDSSVRQNLPSRESNRFDVSRQDPQIRILNGLYRHESRLRPAAHIPDVDAGPASIQIAVGGERRSPVSPVGHSHCPQPDYSSLPPLPGGPGPVPGCRVVVPTSPTRLTKSRERGTFLSGVRNWIRSRKEPVRSEEVMPGQGAREEPEGAPAAATPPVQHDSYRQEIIVAARRSNSRGPAEKRKSIYKQVAEFTEDVSDLSGVSSPVSERAAAAGSVSGSLSGSGLRQHSSGYESSPNVEKVARLTEELSEYRREQREYKEHRPAAGPVSSRVATTAVAPPNPGHVRSSPFADVFGPSRQGRCTPATIYSETRLPSAVTGRQQGQLCSAPESPCADHQATASHISSNYRRDFALGAAAALSLEARAEPTACHQRQTPQNEFLSLNERRKRNARAARRNDSFKRSMKHVEASSPEPVVPSETVAAPATRLLRSPRLPAHFQPRPIFANHRSGCAAQVDSSPARFLYGPESFGHGARSPYSHSMPPSM